MFNAIWPSRYKEKLYDICLEKKAVKSVCRLCQMIKFIYAVNMFLFMFKCLHYARMGVRQTIMRHCHATGSPFPCQILTFFVRQPQLFIFPRNNN